MSDSIPGNPDEVEAWLCAKSLSEFIRQAWAQVEPGSALVWNWHIDAVAEHLEAVSRGEIRKLMIWEPPRHMKSLSVSVLWPDWEWLARPSTQFLTASYKAPLAIRDAVRARNLMRTTWYQGLLRVIHGDDAWTFSGDQNTKSRYQNSKNGHRVALGVNTGTGEDADIRIIDDPHNVTDVESEAARESVITWHDQSWSTRGNDPTTVRDVMMGQRTHEGDLQGVTLRKEGRDTEGGLWTVLDLPARYEPQAYVTVLGFKDPREEAGELLWPDRFPEHAQMELETRLGPYATAAQMQQRPTPKGGAKVTAGMFDQRWETLPPPANVRRAVWYFDLTFGSESATASYNGGHLWLEVEEGGSIRYYLVDRRMQRGGTMTQISMLSGCREPWTQYRPEVIVEKKANGAAMAELLKQKVPGILAKEPPKGNVRDRKEVAFDAAVVPMAAAQRIVLPADHIAPWTKDVLTCWLRFPRIKPDEDADCASGGLWELGVRGGSSSLAVVQVTAQNMAARGERRREAMQRRIKAGR